MAITRAQQAKQMLQDGGRIGFFTAGLAAGDNISPGTSTSGGQRNTGGGNQNTGNAREDYITNYVSKSKVKGGGKLKGLPGTDMYEDKVITGDDVRKAKDRYEKQFYDKGQVPPLGSRPTDFRTKINQRNKQKRLNYINRLIDARRQKISRGLFNVENMPGVDLEETEDYFGFAPSVKDLVEQGFYRKDGRFAKGDIPDFNTIDMPGSLRIVQDIFEGPVTSDRLKQLNEEIKTLEGLRTTEGLEGTSFNELMETYEPNRFELLNPPTGGDNASNQSQVDPCKGPNPPAYCNVGGDDDTTTPPPSTGVFAGIAPRFAGSTFDFDALRAGAMDGGMIEDTPVGGIMDLESGRQMYFLGKLVKKAKRAVKKVVKSPFGKIALLGLGAGMAGFGPASGLFGSGKGLAFKQFLMGGKTLPPSMGFKSKGLLGGILDYAKANPYKSIFAGSTLLGLMGDKDDDGFDIDKYYRTAGLGGQEGIDAIRLQGLNALSNRFRVADGGRIGLKDGPSLESILEGRIPPMPMPDPLQKILEKMTPEEKEMFKMRMEIMKRGFIRNIEPNPDAVKPVPMPTYGPDGKRSFAEGGDAEPVAKKTMPLIDMDGKEKDYRETGGFVEMGRMERADDVPARLSKNEFVFTADAVRNAGEGDIDKGAEVMYNMMKNLEAGGEVSEESQGLEGARKMFQTSQRLGEVL